MLERECGFLVNFWLLVRLVRNLLKLFGKSIYIQMYQPANPDTVGGGGHGGDVVVAQVDMVVMWW
ncbi:hypothetical protein Hanom_Chr12g01082531 [Helianthus anomalus]